MSKRLKNHFVLGITGKIGAGKSTVAKILEKEGWAKLDCDAIVHELYQSGGRGADKIQTFFGDKFIKKDKSVNRRKLLKTLLKNTKKWNILNRLIHPLIADEIERKIRKITSPKVALEIQIFDEKLFGDLIDKLWVIQAPDTLRHQRLTRDKEEIEAIEAQQEALPKPTGATHISNSSSQDDLLKTVSEIRIL